MRLLTASCLAAVLSIGPGLVLPAPAAAQGIAVFDTTNYAQNLIQASRALEQVTNQVRSLQNEAAMLENMARNLKRIDFPELKAINSAMQRIDGLMSKADGIALDVGQMDERFRSLFPGAGRALSSDQRVAAARSELDAAMAAYRRAMGVQAGVVENVRADAALLSDLAGRSQDSEGALEAQQAANQLLALSVKQQLQLQQLLAADHQADSLDRARRAQAEEDGRAATQRFLGSGKAYTPPSH